MDAANAVVTAKFAAVTNAAVLEEVGLEAAVFAAVYDAFAADKAVLTRSAAAAVEFDKPFEYDAAVAAAPAVTAAVVAAVTAIYALFEFVGEIDEAAVFAAV